MKITDPDEIEYMTYFIQFLTCTTALKAEKVLEKIWNYYVESLEELKITGKQRDFILADGVVNFVYALFSSAYNNHVK
jgi:hypothetical protein